MHWFILLFLWNKMALLFFCLCVMDTFGNRRICGSGASIWRGERTGDSSYNIYISTEWSSLWRYPYSHSIWNPLSGSLHKISSKWHILNHLMPFFDLRFIFFPTELLSDERSQLCKQRKSCALSALCFAGLRGGSFTHYDASHNGGLNSGRDGHRQR